ncbi:MAG: DNA-directed RNA polymerase subunit D, partial [Candidatus Thermoplasmatota archaeon]
MELKILTLSPPEHDTKAKILISGTAPYLVNALRRTLIADVPKMAIDTVEFHLGSIRDPETGKEYESVSPLFDEILAHRLAMLPIPTDLKIFEFRDKCKCGGEGCPTCTIMYSINKKGPTTVYSGDLEPLGDRRFAIKDDKIPIVKLNDKQAPLIYATAILGTGRQHAKWQAVCGIGYKYYPIITIKNNLCDMCKKCLEDCPSNVLKEENGKIKVSKLEDCTICKRCMEVCERNAIEVSGDDKKFILSFETDGSITTSDA